MFQALSRQEDADKHHKVQQQQQEQGLSLFDNGEDINIDIMRMMMDYCLRVGDTGAELLTMHHRIQNHNSVESMTTFCSHRACIHPCCVRGCLHMCVRACSNVCQRMDPVGHMKAKAWEKWQEQLFDNKFQVCADVCACMRACIYTLFSMFTHVHARMHVVRVRPVCSGMRVGPFWLAICDP
jgi:hypothetical protein